MIWKQVENSRLTKLSKKLASAQLEVCSYFKDRDHLYSIPFDSTTMILFYRQDVFDKYEEEMHRDLGYLPVPGSSNFTWERYIEVAQWMKENVPETEIKYPSIHMSKKHNSIYTEFSNLLAAYGGDYFSEPEVAVLGGDKAGELQSREPEFVKALERYRELVSLEPALTEQQKLVY